MISRRIIAVLTFEDGSLTRTQNFIADYTYTQNFINNTLFDEIVIIDISKNNKNRAKFYDVVKKFAENCFVPICVGGKIKTFSEVRKFQELGVDKILINSSFVTNPTLIKRIIKTYGNQFVVIGIDFKKIKSKYVCYFNRGKKKINKNIKKYLSEMNKTSPGEILLQSIDRDGTFHGFDLKILKFVKKHLTCPLLVCGGAGNWDHFVDAFSVGGADGVCTNNIFHLTYQSVLSAKEHCKKKLIEIRLER